MARRTGCTFPECEKPKDEDRKAGLCTDHTEDWLRSPEWREATKDENVRVLMNIGATSNAMREVAKFRRKWAKRVSAEAEG